MRDLHLASPADTARLAHLIGSRLSVGDVLLLEGEIGAGKTHFARSLILSLIEQPEDVPSPTFTLVQSYETHSGMIWHADLYRLTSVHEIEELGLTDAFENAICLVEWPDRLGDLMPDNALRIAFDMGDLPEHRKLRLTWQAVKWNGILDGVGT